MPNHRLARSVPALWRQLVQANCWSLRELYRPLETPGANRLRDAHAALDCTVCAPWLPPAQKR